MDKFFALHVQNIEADLKLGYVMYNKNIKNASKTWKNEEDDNDNIEYFLISASSTKSRKIIANYFTQFPLFSSKRLNYLDWYACHNLIVMNKHTTQEGRNIALSLKLGMNKKRTYYNWDHLSNLVL